MLRMSRRRFCATTLAVSGAVGVGAWGARNRGHAVLEFQSRTSCALGSQIRLTVGHAQSEVACRAIDAALEEIRQIESLMSIYRPDSQLSRLNRERSVGDPHPYLVDVLRRSVALARQTGGAFDVTVQPLWDTYAEAAAAGTTPDEADIEAARSRVDWRQIEVTPRRVRLAIDGGAVTLNAIAQGYAADRAAAMLRRCGIEHGLVDTGEIAALGSHGIRLAFSCF